MSIETFGCVNCIKMDYGVEEGGLPQDQLEYDFAEDALDYEAYLAEAQQVIFTQQLQEPVTIGSVLICTGTPSEDLPRLTLDIGCGQLESGSADIAIHFDVRLTQLYVVRNTRRHNKWGPEETTSFRSFPFKFGRPFTIEILFDETELLCAVDGEVYCTYPYRSPSALTASWLQVTGVRDAVITINKTDVFPTLAPTPLEVPLRASIDSIDEGDEPQWRPNVIATIPGGIPEGYQLVIYGKIRSVLHSFSIEVCEAAREWPPPAAALWARVRAGDAVRGRQLVTLNSRLGAWGAERCQRTATLVPGTHTTIRVVNSASEWTVYADDVGIGSLEHRGSAREARAVRLRGDLYPARLAVCPASASPLLEPNVTLAHARDT